MMRDSVALGYDVLFSTQILSRVKPAVGGESHVAEKKKKNKTKKIPRVEDYLNQRDYLGAITLLEVSNHT